MLRKTVLMAALLAPSPALAQGNRPPPPQNLCAGNVIVETVRPKLSLPGGVYTYEVLLQNTDAARRRGYSVTVTFENFAALARDLGATISIPNNRVSMVVAAGLHSRSNETQFGTVSVNSQRTTLGAGVGVRYDSGPISQGSPAAVRLTDCRPVGG